jgi:hypothetical protein
MVEVDHGITLTAKSVRSIDMGTCTKCEVWGMMTGGLYSFPGMKKTQQYLLCPQCFYEVAEFIKPNLWIEDHSMELSEVEDALRQINE